MARNSRIGTLLVAAAPCGGGQLCGADAGRDAVCSGVTGDGRPVLPGGGGSPAPEARPRRPRVVEPQPRAQPLRLLAARRAAGAHADSSTPRPWPSLRSAVSVSGIVAVSGCAFFWIPPWYRIRVVHGSPMLRPGHHGHNAHAPWMSWPRGAPLCCVSDAAVRRGCCRCAPNAHIRVPGTRRVNAHLRTCRA